MMRERLSKVILLIFVFALSPWYFTCCPAWTEPSVDCLVGDEGSWCCQNDIGVLEVHAHGEQCSILLFCRLKMRLHDCFFRSDVWSSCLITTSSTIYEHNNLGSNKHRFDYFCGSCCSNMECSFLFAKTIAKEGNEMEFLKYFTRPVVTNMAPFRPFWVILVIVWQRNQWD